MEREKRLKTHKEHSKMLPQLTTMNAIGGQAVIVIYISLIFCSLTPDNILNIIVLLILAGVSITAVFGENGIISGAQKAKEKTDEAIEQEQEDVGKLVNQLEEFEREGLPDTVKEAIQKGTIFTVNKQIKDATGKTMTVPKGFKVKEGELIENGVVIADSEGNEFVWVPCEEGDYKKHEYEVKEVDDTSSTADGENKDKGWNTYSYRKYSDWKDDEIDETANKESVKNNGGFYIARYEAGVPKGASFYVDASAEGVNAKTYPTSKNDISGDIKPVSKKGVQAWNLISQINALKVSGRMYSGDTYGVRSQLVDGTAWDTAVTWMSEDYEGIEKDSTKYGNYKNSTGGNQITEDNCLFAEHLYKFEKSDIKQIGWCIGKIYQYGLFTSGYKANWSGTDASIKYNSYSNDTNTYKYDHFVEMATGASANTKLKNIYDMAGNMYEWTTEYGYHGSTSSGTKYAVRRGGGFDVNGRDYPASIRNGSHSNSYVSAPCFGFRVVLYVK